jgi:hypothetical protein
MTMKQDLMARLLKGWTTPVDALNDCNCFSLSQRVGEWRRDRDSSIRELRCGPDGSIVRRPPYIIDKWVDLPNGKRVKAYRAIK